MRDTVASMDPLYREIGRRISQLRARRRPKRMSQQALATAVGISRASIANIERGHHRVQIHVLYEIAAVLGVEPHDLLPHPNQQSVALLPANIRKQLRPEELRAIERLMQRKEVSRDEK